VRRFSCNIARTTLSLVDKVVREKLKSLEAIERSFFI
jgi:hypothetical protein